MTRYVTRSSITPGPAETDALLQVCLLREKAHQKKNFTPEGSIENLASGTYYLTEVDDMFRRQYEIKA